MEQKKTLEVLHAQRTAVSASVARLAAFEKSMPLLLHGTVDPSVVSWHSRVTADAAVAADVVVVASLTDSLLAATGTGALVVVVEAGTCKHILFVVLLPEPPPPLPARGSSSSSDCSVRPTRMTAPLTRMTLAPVATSVATPIDGIPIKRDDDDVVDVDGIQLDDNIMGWNTRKHVNMTNIMPPSTRAFGMLLLLLEEAGAADSDDDDDERCPCTPLSSKFGICKCGGN